MSYAPDDADAILAWAALALIFGALGIATYCLLIR